MLKEGKWNFHFSNVEKNFRGNRDGEGEIGSKVSSATMCVSVAQTTSYESENRRKIHHSTIV